VSAPPIRREGRKPSRRAPEGHSRRRALAASPHAPAQPCALHPAARAPQAAGVAVRRRPRRRQPDGAPARGDDRRPGAPRPRGPRDWAGATRGHRPRARLRAPRRTRLRHPASGPACLQRMQPLTGCRQTRLLQQVHALPDCGRRLLNPSADSHRPLCRATPPEIITERRRRGGDAQVGATGASGLHAGRGGGTHKLQRGGALQGGARRGASSRSCAGDGGGGRGSAPAAVALACHSRRAHQAPPAVPGARSARHRALPAASPPAPYRGARAESGGAPEGRGRRRAHLSTHQALARRADAVQGCAARRWF
jgi:hypothetical protein